MDFVTSGHRGRHRHRFLHTGGGGDRGYVMTLLVPLARAHRATLLFAHSMVRFVRGNSLTEDALCAFIQQQHVRATQIAYRLTQRGNI